MEAPWPVRKINQDGDVGEKGSKYKPKDLSYYGATTAEAVVNLAEERLSMDLDGDGDVGLKGRSPANFARVTPTPPSEGRFTPPTGRATPPSGRVTPTPPSGRATPA